MNKLIEIFNKINVNGGKCFLVGGYVRDKILGLTSKDIDVEVYGMNYDDLVTHLSEFGSPELLGKSFGVVKLRVDGMDIDFSLPRRDSKNGIGHKEFCVEFCPDMSLEEAASRRDFTMNSVSIDPLSNEMIDPFNGLKDIADRILRPTSKAFTEDPLRILRGFQFSARFGFSPSFELEYYALKSLSEFHSLPKERIWTEWEKWASKGSYYSTSLNYLYKIVPVYPEIQNLMAVPQDKTWHPEGNVFVHTGYVLDEMAKICAHNNIVGDDRLVLIFSALCHDMGKVDTTVIGERITSHGHESSSVKFAESFLSSIMCPPRIIKRVCCLVELHMAANNHPTPKSVNRLTSKLASGNSSLRELCWLIEADQFGRPPRPRERSENLTELLNIGLKLNIMDNPPPRIVDGEYLKSLGFEEGKLLGEVLEKLYALQLAGSLKQEDDVLKKIKEMGYNILVRRI